MSAPVLAFVLIAAFFAAVPAASYFKTLDPGLGREARVPIIVGAIAGFAIGFASASPLAIGIVLTISAQFTCGT